MRASRPAPRARPRRPTTSGSCARSTASAFGLAQARAGVAAPAPALRSAPGARSPARDGAGAARRRRLRAAVARPASRPAIWALNRLLRSDFEPDISAAAIFRSGVDAATELARAAAGRRRPRDHRPHPPRRPRRGRSRLAAGRRRPPPQHRQLGLRLRLPPPRHAARPLLAGNRHLARGQRPAAARAAAARALPRRADASWSRRSRCAREPARRPSHSAMIAPISAPGVLLQEVAGVLDRPRRREVELARRPARRPRRAGPGRSRPRGPASGRSSSRSAVGDPFALGRAGRVGLGRQDQREGAGAGLRLRASV